MLLDGPVFLTANKEAGVDRGLRAPQAGEAARIAISRDENTEPAAYYARRTSLSKPMSSKTRTLQTSSRVGRTHVLGGVAVSLPRQI
jgi:hypothetical protein